MSNNENITFPLELEEDYLLAKERFGWSKEEYLNYLVQGNKGYVEEELVSYLNSALHISDVWGTKVVSEVEFGRSKVNPELLDITFKVNKKYLSAPLEVFVGVVTEDSISASPLLYSCSLLDALRLLTSHWFYWLGGRKSLLLTGRFQASSTLSSLEDVYSSTYEVQEFPGFGASIFLRKKPIKVIAGTDRDFIVGELVEVHYSLYLNEFNHGCITDGGSDSFVVGGANDFTISPKTFDVYCKDFILSGYYGYAQEYEYTPYTGFKGIDNLLCTLPYVSCVSVSQVE